MDEYILRSYIRKMAMFETRYTMETKTDATVLLRMIEDAPAADVAPVVHGRWICGDYYDVGDVCSECDWDSQMISPSYHYCPNCGAKMDGGDNSATD